MDRVGKDVRRVLADGGYDFASCRKYLNKRGIQDCIPPRKNGTEENGLEERNFALGISSLFGGGKEGVHGKKYQDITREALPKPHFLG